MPRQERQQQGRQRQPLQGRQQQGRQQQGRQQQGRQQRQRQQRQSLQYHNEFPAQDTENSIPFYNARVFSMYESLIQSYTHFTYHANHMYNVLEQLLHGPRNSINSNPYPWMIIPHPQQQQQQQSPQSQTHQSQQSQQPQSQSQTQQSQQQQSQTHQSQQPQTQQQQPQSQQPQSHQSQQQPQSQQPQTQQPQTQQPQTQQSHRQQPQTQQSQRQQSQRQQFETNIMNALVGMMNAPEERRLTSEQLIERVEPIVFGNIVNPINNVCSITHDVFEPTQRVSRIRHCGHIFNSDSLAHWLHMNNTCPTCRHNLLTDPRRQEPEINIGSLYNELLRTSRNIPGFELNSVNDDSIVFSFDSLRGSTGSGATGSGATGATRRTYDDVD